MHLPAPFRAAVGLVATAADEVKHLPDRAVELPMLAVSTALQMSLRAQQRYARLAARGDEVLSRERAGAEPPEWATFDEPVSTEELRRSALAQLDSLSAGKTSSRFFDELFGTDDPGRPAGGSTHPSAYGADPHADDPGDDSGEDDGPTATVTPILQAPTAEARAEDAAAAAAPTGKAAATTPAVTQSPAKGAAKKTAAKKAARKAPAKKAAPNATDPAAARATPVNKTVNKPRHTAPSKFDDVGDAADD